MAYLAPNLMYQRQMVEVEVEVETIIEPDGATDNIGRESVTLICS